jgi:hypothetical protein
VRGVETSFYAPKGNLPIGVSKIWTCPVRSPDISGKCYWNPVLAPNISGAHRLSMGKAAGTDMSSLGTGYVRRMPLEPKEWARLIQQKDLVAGR